MKELTYTGEFSARKLYNELLEAGVPAEWIESRTAGRQHLVVQVDENLAVGYEDPVLDEDDQLTYNEDGEIITELVWRKPDGTPVTVPKRSVPAGARQGTHVQLGPDTVTIKVPSRISDATVQAVIDAHDPAPPPPTLSLEDRIAAIEAQLAGP
jgi:hypothetical protein